MPKYLYKVKYSKAGFDGIRAEGAAARVRFIGDFASGLGGTLESFHFAFGDIDAYLVVDLPNDETAAAISLAVASSGTGSTAVTTLLSGEQIDAALAKQVPYRAPGQ